jgi:acyl carrier protein
LPSPRQKFEKIAFNDKLLPALGSRFNFTETVRSPGPQQRARAELWFLEGPLMSETIQARVLRVIATTQRIPLEKVKPDSTFEELGIDSMDSINILFDLESEFDIEIKDEDAKKIRTIREMIDGVTYLVDSKQNPSAQTATE